MKPCPRAMEACAAGAMWYLTRCPWGFYWGALSTDIFLFKHCPGHVHCPDLVNLSKANTNSNTTSLAAAKWFVSAVRPSVKIAQTLLSWVTKVNWSPHGCSNACSSWVVPTGLEEQRGSTNSHWQIQVITTGEETVLIFAQCYWERSHFCIKIKCSPSEAEKKQWSWNLPFYFSATTPLKQK